MNSDSILAALLIKSQLGLDATFAKNGLSTAVGMFDCRILNNNELLISGPGLNETISRDRVTILGSLVEYLIEHGDSIVVSPRDIREARISNLMNKYDVDSNFIKTAISYAHQLVDK